MNVIINVFPFSLELPNRGVQKVVEIAKKELPKMVESTEKNKTKVMIDHIKSLRDLHAAAEVI